MKPRPDELSSLHEIEGLTRRETALLSDHAALGAASSRAVDNITLQIKMAKNSTMLEALCVVNKGYFTLSKQARSLQKKIVQRYCDSDCCQGEERRKEEW